MSLCQVEGECCFLSGSGRVLLTQIDGRQQYESLLHERIRAPELPTSSFALPEGEKYLIQRGS